MQLITDVLKFAIIFIIFVIVCIEGRSNNWAALWELLQLL